MAAASVTRALGLPVTMDEGSTDANYPQSLGIPAITIDGGGRGYGEVGFKLDPTEPGFVRVDNRFFKRLFGDFSPKRGDLVFAKSGELLGIMVNSDYCALLKDFSAAKTIVPSENLAGEKTGAILDGLAARVRALPLKMQ